MSIAEEIRRKWRPRRSTSHKGDFGRVFILAGSRGLAGAAHLAAMAALRTGAGLVTLGVPEKVYPVLARREAEIMVRPYPSNRDGSLSLRAFAPLRAFLKKQDVFALGPGLSQNSGTQRLIRKLVAASHQPLVIDADGLNAFKGHTKALEACRGRAILTPHPGEFLRLFGGTLPAKDHDRKKRAKDAAQKYQVIIVLKGHHTVVASPDDKTYINRTGNPGMATGGTGDVLTGMIAALAGQGFSLWESARFGVYLHGLAGDSAARRKGQVSLIAGDLLSEIPAAVRKVTRISTGR